MTGEPREIQSMGPGHPADCPCPRCRGFQPGNDLATKHGAYSKPDIDLRLGEAVDALADRLRPHVPTYRPGDEVALQMLSLAIVRIHRAATAIDASTNADDLAKLRADERGWVNTVRRYLNDLGLSPKARAELKLDVAMTARALSLVDLVEQAEEEQQRELPAT